MLGSCLFAEVRKRRSTLSWAAPSGNVAMPGVSFFGLIDAGPGLRAGDRARVIAYNPVRLTGVIIPSAAVIVYGSKSWCYVETGPKKYERRLVSLDSPVDDGFLVTNGFDPGTHVVVKGASVLLAREANPASLDDDDDTSRSIPGLSAPDVFSLHPRKPVLAAANVDQAGSRHSKYFRFIASTPLTSAPTERLKV